MTDLLYLGVAGAAAHFLLYRALITRWLWSRYPKAIEPFFACSACTGFWIGAAVGFLWMARGIPALGLAADDPILPAASGVMTMVMAPIVSFLHLWALEQLSPHVGPTDEE